MTPEVAAVLAGELDGCLIEGDCRPVLAEIPHAAPVYVITDPPYGKALVNHGRMDGSRRLADYHCPGDDSQAVGAEVLAMAAAAGWPTVAFAAPMLPWPGKWRQWLVWDKGGGVGGGGDTATTWKQTWELLQFARTGRLAGTRDSAVLPFYVGRQASHLHVAQKPLPLMLYLLHKVCPAGCIVVDPFAGSGTTLIAAKSLGYRYVGVELDAGYAEVCRRRLAGQCRPLYGTDPAV
jgi:site-specific DNA-methyltransferase (adenine-specific)